MTDDTIDDPQRRRSDPEPQDLQDIVLAEVLAEVLAKLKDTP